MNFLEEKNKHASGPINVNSYFDNSEENIPEEDRIGNIGIKLSGDNFNKKSSKRKEDKLKNKLTIDRLKKNISFTRGKHSKKEKRKSSKIFGRKRHRKSITEEIYEKDEIGTTPPESDQAISVDKSGEINKFLFFLYLIDIL